MDTASYRQYVSQYAAEELGLTIYIGGVFGDPDGQSVLVTMINEQTSSAVFTDQPATRVTQGQYQLQLTSAQSSVVGNFSLVWTYYISGVAQEYQTYLQIGAANPNYDFLADPMKQIVENVFMRFADLFDSQDGGPNLATYFQTRFDRGRVAQLLRVAVGKLNTMAQPFMTFGIGDGGANFPVQQWGPLLEQALYVEAVRHLRRSYVEQPELQGGQVTRLDRTRYAQYWAEILQEEEDILRQSRDVFKILAMSLSKPAVLVSGGVFGRFGPTRYAGSMAARPRYYARFY
jgi:hypothetical protein